MNGIDPKTSIATEAEWSNLARIAVSGSNGGSAGGFVETKKTHHGPYNIVFHHAVLTKQGMGLDYLTYHSTPFPTYAAAKKYADSLNWSITPVPHRTKLPEMEF